MIPDKANKQLKRNQSTANRVTIVCLLSLLIGGGWALIIIEGGGPEALGAIIPMMIVGLIHLVGAPLAILYAYETYLPRKNILVYFYFVFYIVFSFFVVGPEAIVYYLLFTVVIIVTLLISITSTYFKKIKQQKPHQ